VVRAVRGFAQYSENGVDWRSLNVGKVLSAGAHVRSRADTTVDLFLGANGSMVRVLPGSNVKLEKLSMLVIGDSRFFETVLDVTGGDVLATSRRPAHGCKFTIKSPSGVRQLVPQ
jgi:hypothetical protein